MANFLNKLGDMAKNAADKTGDLIEQGRLNSKISTEEATIVKLKEQIGNFYWERYASGVQTDAEIQERCEAIKTSQATIAAIRAEIDILKGEQAVPTATPAAAVKCPACGAENPSGTKFCGECGMKLE